jgi:hypothetical protein
MLVLVGVMVRIGWGPARGGAVEGFKLHAERNLPLRERAKREVV